MANNSISGLVVLAEIRPEEISTIESQTIVGVRPHHEVHLGVTAAAIFQNRARPHEVATNGEIAAITTNGVGAVTTTDFLGILAVGEMAVERHVMAPERPGAGSPLGAVGRRLVGAHPDLKEWTIRRPEQDGAPLAEPRPRGSADLGGNRLKKIAAKAGEGVPLAIKRPRADGAQLATVPLLEIGLLEVSFKNLDHHFDCI